MSALMFQPGGLRPRVGLKGPRVTGWLTELGIAAPAGPNTWTESDDGADTGLLVARLGSSEFFLEDGGAAGAAVRHLSSALQAGLPGIYPVLREDAAFLLSGEGALDVLAQVCNVNFAALDLSARPVIMTMLIGVSVLIVPQTVAGGVRYRIWCDPTFGWYLDESVGTVVVDCGGSHGGESA